MLLLVSRPTILLLNILFQVFALFLSMKLERHHVQFFTAVCNDWLLLLESDEAKDIVVNALHYQVKVGHVKVAAFVIMPNHLHLIWRIQNECRLEDVQRDFLKFTARELLRLIETPSCCWSKYFVIVGLPTNNLAAEYPISGFRIIFKHEIGASSCSVLHRCMQ
jgi:REP element-mobilizing transposase RayT